MATTSNWCRCTSCHAGYGWEDASYDFTDVSRVDCLVCHDTTGTYKKTPTACGQEAPGLDLVKIARSVGTPSRATCGACHFYGGGGDGIKHGDLDTTLIRADRSHDVHMGGENFSCQRCHRTQGHKIAGASTSCAVSEGRVSCEDCHSKRPHAEDNPVLRSLNEHCEAVSCQTCHIPTFAKAKPTLMSWDWSKAGLDPEKGSDIEKGACSPKYYKKKGVLTKAQNVKPVYAWYNGKHYRYLAGDPVDMNGATGLNRPAGDIKDPRAKITPYKLHEGVQPADATYGYLIVPKLWKGFWSHFDWNKASEAGMKDAGLKYSGKIKFVKTVMYWRLNHEVVPKEKALSCTDCHKKDGAIDFKALGYQGDPSVVGSRKNLFSAKDYKPSKKKD